MATEVRHPLWKNVVDLHHRNRIYYKVTFRETEDDIKLVLRNEKGEHLPSPIVQTIRKNRRFARIVEITVGERWTGFLYYYTYWKGIESFGEAEIYKLLEDVAPFIKSISERDLVNILWSNLIRLLGGPDTQLTLLELRGDNGTQLAAIFPWASDKTLLKRKESCRCSGLRTSGDRLQPRTRPPESF
uniref:PhoP regulatory network protein YrbL n=1 Tax=Steinernema glaseri TaxID=37863 RepID=A0A1I7ZDD6_9BILA